MNKVNESVREWGCDSFQESSYRIPLLGSISLSHEVFVYSMLALASFYGLCVKPLCPRTATRLPAPSGSRSY